MTELTVGTHDVNFAEEIGQVRGMDSMMPAVSERLVGVLTGDLAPARIGIDALALFIENPKGKRQLNSLFRRELR